MDIASLIITLLLAVLMLYLVVRLPMAIFGNLRAGHQFRESLAEALDELRLSRMLGFLGIDKARYLHKESALDIQQQMDRCDNCDAKGQCDDMFGKDQPAEIESLGFCANIDDLKGMRESR